MSASDAGKPEFSRWRTILWPIHNHELNKLIPMLLIFFLISFTYNMLHTLKDTLVVTTAGAEAIPFIKVWTMLPGAILLTFLFTRLSNRYSREKVCYLMLSLFLGYFFLFITLLYPNREAINFNQSADALQVLLPAGFKGLIGMYRNWTITLFYAMSELWSNIIFAMLIWGFANQITRLNEARRFYGLFGLGTNFSGVVAGYAIVYFSEHQYNPNLPFGNDSWEQSMVIQISLLLASGVAAMALIRWMHTQVLSSTRYYDNASAKQEKEMIGKLSMRDSFKYLLRSKYLICIAAIVISYNLVINLTEVIWKDQVRELYPVSLEFNSYMGYVKLWIGIFATISALFVSGNSIRKCGWTFTAMITPAILLLTSVGFFTFFFMKEYFSVGAIITTSMTPLALVVFFGSAQNVLSRAAKYTVFDATKEMSFVPLSAECKVKGKAAIDGVCSRLGKSGGSVIHQSLLVSFASFANSAPYVAGFILAVIIIWSTAISLLGKRFTAITQPTPVLMGDGTLAPLEVRELEPTQAM